MCVYIYIYIYICPAEGGGGRKKMLAMVRRNVTSQDIARISQDNRRGMRRSQEVDDEEIILYYNIL